MSQEATNQERWRERAMTPADVPGVVDLFQRAFGRPTTADHYRWKVRTRPGPVENVALAVDDADRPVFHIAGIPCRAWLSGYERWVMVAVDGMTDPAWRRRGVLTRVTSDLFDRWRTAGIALVVGLPNEQWRSRIGALGWRPMFPLTWLMRPLLPERILSRRTGIAVVDRARWIGRWWNRWWDGGATGDVEVSNLEHAGPEWDRFWLEARNGLGPCLVRDAEWINWRFLGAPGAGFRVLAARRAGQPAGYLALRVRDGSALIGDVFTARGDDEAFGAMVKAASHHLASEGAATVRVLAPPGTWAFRAYRRLGFFASRHAFAVHGVVLDPAASESTLRDGSRWLLSGSDFDVV